MEFHVVNPAKKTKGFCSVFGCNSKACRSPQLAFHYFPSPNRNFVFVENKMGQEQKIDVLVAWKRALKMVKPVSKNMLVCSLHFQEKDYFPHADKAQRKKLKKTAIPSVNLPVTSHSTSETKMWKEPAKSVDMPSMGTLYESHRTEAEFEIGNTYTVCYGLPNEVYACGMGVQVNTLKIKTICDNIETDQQLNTLTGLRSFKLLT